MAITDYASLQAAVSRWAGGSSDSNFAEAVRDVKERVTYCSICNNITDADPCVFCGDAAEALQSMDAGAQIQKDKSLGQMSFFGGEENVAQEANRETNASSPGLTGVGFCDPGHGAIDALSRDEYIQDINRAAPDLYVSSVLVGTNPMALAAFNLTSIGPSELFNRANPVATRLLTWAS